MTKNHESIGMKMPIRTTRLEIRPITHVDVDEMVKAIHESKEKLQKWMPWAENIPSVEEYHNIVANSIKKMEEREEFWFMAFTHDGRMVISTGFHDIKWKVPRCSIGYWCRTSDEGNGYVTEVANALTRYAFEEMGMRKVMIDMDTENTASENVAKRLNFIHEFDDIGGLIIPNCSELRTKRVYSCFDPKTLPALDVSW
jgi:RimJ/RimL family protein N-acetyltransferase